MRLIASTLIALTIGIPQVQAASYELPLDRACRFQYDDGKAGWTPSEVERTIYCAVRRWPVPGGVEQAMNIAWRESRFEQYAYNPSGCSGVYQWAPSTWDAVRQMFPHLRRTLGPSVFNARSNVMFAIRYAHQYGWSPWSTA